MPVLPSNSEPVFGRSAEGAAIFRGALAAAGNRLWAPLLSLAATPYLLDRLGAESYGVFALTLSVVAWLSLADFGLAPALRVRLARGDGSPGDTGRLFSLAVRAQTLVGLAVAAIGAALAIALPDWLGLEAEQARAAAELIGWLTLGTALSIFSSPFSAAIEARGFVALVQVGRTLRALARTALAVLFVARGAGVEALGVAHLIAAAGEAAFSILLCRVRAPDLQRRAPNGRLAELRPLLGGGVWLTAGVLAGVLIGGLDRAVVAKYLSLEATTRFALSAALFLFLEGLLTRAADAARPFLAARLGAGRAGDARRLHARLRELCALGGVAAAAVGFAANAAFVGAWAGQGHYAGAMTDAFFAANLALHLWVLPQRAALTAGWRLRGQVGVRLAEGCLNLLLSVLLVGWWGLAGVAAGTTLAALAFSAWALPRMASRVSGAAPWLGLGRAAWLAAVLAPVAWTARELAIAAGGWAAAALAACAVTSAAAAAIALLVLQPLPGGLSWRPAGARAAEAAR